MERPAMTQLVILVVSLVAVLSLSAVAFWKGVL